MKKEDPHKAELQKDQSILFCDKNDPTKTVFLMEAPYMFDQAGAQSTDIIVDLQAKGKGYLLTVTPSADWMNSDERVFPIILDPSLQTSLDPTKIKDNHVSQNLPNDNFIVSDRIKTGYGSTSHIKVPGIRNLSLRMFLDLIRYIAPRLLYSM